MAVETRENILDEESVETLLRHKELHVEGHDKKFKAKLDQCGKQHVEVATRAQCIYDSKTKNTADEHGTHLYARIWLWKVLRFAMNTIKWSLKL